MTTQEKASTLNKLAEAFERVNGFERLLENRDPDVIIRFNKAITNTINEIDAKDLSPQHSV